MKTITYRGGKKNLSAVLTVLIVLGLGFQAAYANVTSLKDFNNTGDLTSDFDDDGTPVFTNLADSGINNTGSIDVPLGSDDLWTTKEGYTVAGDGDVYRFSAYFLIKANSGRGGLGFSTPDSTPGGVYATPTEGIGVTFHGGGGEFINNGSTLQTLSWPPDLVIGDWYWMELEVSAEGSNTYDLRFRIYETDSSGTIGVMKTEKTYDNLVNSDVGTSSIIHTFFSANGSRMEKIDNYKIELEGGASVVEEGTPVVPSEEVTGVGDTTATSGGEVTDDQGSPVTVRGVCYSTSQNPTTADTCTTDGSGLGSYTSSLTGLSPGTTYYVRAYATNGNGTTYGGEETFTTTGVAGPVSGGGGGNSAGPAIEGCTYESATNYNPEANVEDLSCVFENEKSKKNQDKEMPTKVTICHKGHEITVAYPAARSHIKLHEEDYIGQCDNNEEEDESGYEEEGSEEDEGSEEEDESGYEEEGSEEDEGSEEEDESGYEEEGSEEDEGSEEEDESGYEEEGSEEDEGSEEEDESGYEEEGSEEDEGSEEEDESGYEEEGSEEDEGGNGRVDQVIICHDDENTLVDYSQGREYLEQGDHLGLCGDTEMADIGGEPFMPEESTGEYITLESAPEDESTETTLENPENDATCKEDTGSNSYRICAMGTNLTSFGGFLDNVICEGFVEAGTSNFTDIVTRTDTLDISVKMIRDGKNYSEISDKINIGLEKQIITPFRDDFEADRYVTRSEAYAMVMAAVCLYPTGPVENGWMKNLHSVALDEGITNREWEIFEPERSIYAQELYVLSSRAADWAERTGGCKNYPPVCK